jgi:phenylacetate-CoA ligase
MSDRTIARTIRGAIFTGYYQATGRGTILDGVAELNNLHFAPRDVLETQTRAKLAAILSHAAATVPYYRDLIGRKDISTESAFSVLKNLPVLSKAMIRKEGERLVSEKPGTKPKWNTSGGSTGEPIRLLQDKEMAHKHRSAELMYLQWAGHKPGDQHVLIWGVPQETVGKGVSLHERIFRFVCNETYLNCYKISNDLLDSWIETLNRRRPSVIEAYVDAMVALSERVLETGAKVPSPRGIITSAGVLTQEGRELITKAFQAPIFNRYGSREVANVACSCSRNEELHVNEPWCHLEIVNDDGSPCVQGEEGHILVTVYANRTMPLIRYRIEDRGAWGGSDVCRCGRTTRRLARVCGRMSDYLVASDGTKINGTALTTLLYSVSGIQRFQYRQVANGKVVLAAIPAVPSEEASLKKALAKPAAELRQLLKGREVEVLTVKEILPSKSGKYRYIINEMATGPAFRPAEKSETVAHG